MVQVGLTSPPQCQWDECKIQAWPVRHAAGHVTRSMWAPDRSQVSRLPWDFTAGARWTRVLGCCIPPLRGPTPSPPAPEAGANPPLIPPVGLPPPLIFTLLLPLVMSQGSCLPVKVPEDREGASGLCRVRAAQEQMSEKPEAGKASWGKHSMSQTASPGEVN